MKKTTIILALLAAITTAEAQQVALHTFSGVQHFEGTAAFQSAYNASQNGDTIYLSGGGTFTSPGTIDKSLRIYGAGHYPDSTTATGKTIISGSITLRENADNFYLEGIHLTSTLDFYSNVAVDNVTIKYCRIDGTVSVSGNRTNPSKNILFSNMVFGSSISLENAQSALIENSIIFGTIGNSNGSLIRNNTILTQMYYRTESLFGGAQNNYIHNNVILLSRANAGNISNIAVDGSGNTFKNNVFNSAAPNFGNFATAENNYLGVSPVDFLVNQSGNAFDYTHDYHLQNPADYLGTDGTQTGIYGGLSPFKAGSVPSNPHIQEQNISSTVTDGQLNVQIKVAAQSN